MYPDRDTLSNVPRSEYITARDQSMVESGVTEGGKNTQLVFFFVNEHNNTNMKPEAKKQLTIFLEGTKIASHIEKKIELELNVRLVWSSNKLYCEKG